ncbi:MAG: hypothetical protein DRQ56_09965, partial [Gammaproteobacteria bacterium]
CTTERQKTHGTEAEVLYPWHAWFQKRVHVHRLVRRRDRTTLQCTLIGEDRSRTLEVPQWMFDRASCCVMRRAEDPAVCCAALRALAQLLKDTADEGGDAGASTDQSPRPVREGGTDEQEADTPSSNAAESISPAAEDSELEHAAGRCEARGQDSPRSPASRASRSTPRNRQAPGGER